MVFYNFEVEKLFLQSPHSIHCQSVKKIGGNPAIQGIFLAALVCECLSLHSMNDVIVTNDTLSS